MKRIVYGMLVAAAVLGMAVVSWANPIVAERYRVVGTAESTSGETWRIWGLVSGNASGGACTVYISGSGVSTAIKVQTATSYIVRGKTSVGGASDRINIYSDCDSGTFAYSGKQ